MKVYYGVDGIKWVGPDYSNYNREDERKREDEYVGLVTASMQEQGYTAEGEAAFPVADGNARYLMFSKGRSSLLIHLPFGDAYDYPYIERLTKADVLQSINRMKGLKALFGRSS